MGEAKRRRESGDRPVSQATADFFKVEFLDSGREPQVAPDPAYPNGIDVDATDDDNVQSCRVAIPYPAPRCGVMVVQCRRCGFSAGATVAGRVDDPKSIRVPCKPQAGAVGAFPDGASRRPGDEGGINIAVSKPDADGNIYIDFGKEVSWLSLPRQKVVEWCLQMLSRVGVDVQMEVKNPPA